MNNIVLKGYMRNIRYSHSINDVEFYRADMIVKNSVGKENILNLCFKKFSNVYDENEEIELVGNIRTFSRQTETKNKVDIFVFTYFDKPETEISVNNSADIDGRICKLNELRQTRDGKDVLDFIIANNIVVGNTYLNAYIPCVAWGRQAKDISKLGVGSKITIMGPLVSREYKKRISDDDYEIKVAHEVNVEKYTVSND